MIKKTNKKGFTLAELLIVVAIIAVLVAIAVPLFVGALNNAEESVKEANIRAVRGEAIAAILGYSVSDDTGHKIYEEDGTLKGPWKFTAKVAKNGEVTDLTLVAKGEEATKVAAAVALTISAPTAAATEATDDYDKKTGLVTVIIKLQDLDYSKIINGSK